MARGRMISRTLSTSERFASLNDHAGKLAEFCQALYPLLVAHADDWGCQQGDTFTIKHAVHPTSPRKLSEFETTLKCLHNAGLVTWWEEAGKRFLYIRGFAAHQTLRGHDKDGRKRGFPAPPENPSDFAVSAQSCPVAPKSALTELNLTEEKRTEPIRSPRLRAVTAEVASEQDTEEPDPLNSQVASFIRTFCELYPKHRHGARYMVNRARDVPLVRRLLRTYPEQRLVSMAKALFVVNDEWIAETDRGISILSTKAAWLDGRLAEYEAEKGVAIG